MRQPSGEPLGTLRRRLAILACHRCTQLLGKISLRSLARFHDHDQDRNIVPVTLAGSAVVLFDSPNYEQVLSNQGLSVHRRHGAYHNTLPPTSRDPNSTTTFKEDRRR